MEDVSFEVRAVREPRGPLKLSLVCSACGVVRRLHSPQDLAGMCAWSRAHRQEKHPPAPQRSWWQEIIHEIAEAFRAVAG